MLALILLAGCGRGQSEFDVPERTPTPIDPSTTGSVRGTVFYQGPAGEPQVIKIAGNPECSSLQHGPLYSESLRVADGRLQNVFVYIKAGLEGKVFAVPREPIIVDNRQCIYVPHVSGAQVYQPVTLVNSDPTLHNVNVIAKNSKSMNIGLPTEGMKRTISFPAEEVMVQMKCDVHPWMKGFVGVVDHPFFAVTDAAGGYLFEGVPAGNYTIAAWHETLGEKETEIVVQAGESVSAEFEY